jgi:hypothetical protein
MVCQCSVAVKSFQRCLFWHSGPLIWHSEVFVLAFWISDLAFWHSEVFVLAFQRCSRDVWMALASLRTWPLTLLKSARGKHCSTLCA